MTKKHSVLLLTSSVVLLGAPILEAQTTPGAQPGICSRACWSARAGSCGTSLGALTRAIIHHTAGPSDYTSDYETGKARMRSNQNYHMDSNGWCDIGYHFLVDAGGHIYEGRAGSLGSSGSWLRGAHDGCNANSMGFTMLGYFHTPYNHAFTTAAQNAMMNVIAWRMPSGWSPYGSGTYCGNNVGWIDGHRKVKSTACPGDTIHPVYITENYNGGPIRSGVAGRRTASPPPPPPTGTRGGPDIFWYAPGSASDALWFGRSNPLSGTNGGFDMSGDVDVTGTFTPVPGDFNGDGVSDIFWYRPGTASDTQWMGKTSPANGTNGRFTTGHSVNNNGTYIPVPGDFDGDGRTDILWYGPGGDYDTLWRGRETDSGNVNGWFDVGISINVNGTYTPIVGDFNGDGADDIFWYGPGSDSDRLWLGRTNPLSEENGAFIVLGESAVNVSGVYTPVAGDFDNDGQTDIFWYAPGSAADTLWRGRTTDAGGTNGRFTTGIDVDITGTYTPIVGNFNYNGGDDIFWYGPGSDPDRLWLGRAAPISGTNGAFSTTASDVNVNGTYTPFSGNF